MIAKLRLFLGGGGIPLLAAALSACPADCHPGLDPGGQHLATCCLVRMATKVGSPFLLASKTSSSTPSPKGTPLKNPGCHPGLVPGSPFHPRKRLASNAPAQPAPHEPKDRSSCASLSQTCLVNTKHLLLTEITAFGLYCPLSGQSFAVALAQTWFKSFNLVTLAGGIFLIVLNVVDAFGVRGVTRS